MIGKLTEGNITRALIKFSIPMILGNLLQQLYNVADTFIVGHYIGTDALAAVGSSFTIMTFLTSIILGLCMGSDLILNFMNIPRDIFTDTHQYLFIIFLGLVFTFIYNYFSSLLRALGNSKIPLIFLALASIINIGLDIYLVAEVAMGVAGAAVATLIAQAFSAIGIMLYVFLSQKELLPQRKHWHFEREIFEKIKAYSLLTCIQQSVMNFGILMIQGLVNSFGLVTMSAFAAAVKIDSFAYMPVQDFGNAFSTYIAQNKGAGLEERIHKGFKVAVVMASIFCIFISALVFIFADKLMLIFIESSKSEIIYQGAQYLRIEGACYLGIGCLFLLYGYYRGVGKPGISVVLTVISLGTRVVLAYLLAPLFGTLAIWWAIPIGWFLADLIGIMYGLKKERWTNRYIDK